MQLLGHKGDLMLIHARRTFDELSQAQLDFAQSRLFDSLEPTMSYVSIVELGMYEMTAKIHEQLAEQGLTLGSDDYEQAFDVAMEVQKTRVMSRLYIDLPERRHVCFYPMNKKRGEIKNWYSVPFEERAQMMREHGHIGRGYTGKVTQIISGSIGLDDWEWGVDLFADDPMVVQEVDLRNALRPRQRRIRRIRPLLRRPAVRAVTPRRSARRPHAAARHGSAREIALPRPSRAGSTAEPLSKGEGLGVGLRSRGRSCRSTSSGCRAACSAEARRSSRRR